MPSMRRTLSLEDYFGLEEYANLKHEYISGTMVAMAGGSREHGLWATNLARLLGIALHGRPGSVHNSDVRVRIDAADMNTYPDLSVVCGPVILDHRDRHAVTNPCLLAEVLSPGTEDHDRGSKLATYQQLPSVREILFVCHDVRRLDLVQRGTGGTWVRSSAGAGQVLKLELGVELDVDAVYFDPSADR